MLLLSMGSAIFRNFDDKRLKVNGKTGSVRQFGKNAWGLYDMHGNVWERCQDWYGAYPSRLTPDKKKLFVADPTGPSTGISGK